MKQFSQAEAEFRKLWAAANLEGAGGDDDESRGKRAAAIQARNKFETVDLAVSKPAGKPPSAKKVSLIFSIFI